MIKQNRLVNTCLCATLVVAGGLGLYKFLILHGQAYHKSIPTELLTREATLLKETGSLRSNFNRLPWPRYCVPLPLSPQNPNIETFAENAPQYELAFKEGAEIARKYETNQVALREIHRKKLELNGIDPERENYLIATSALKIYGSLGCIYLGGMLGRRQIYKWLEERKKKKK